MRCRAPDAGANVVPTSVQVNLVDGMSEFLRVRCHVRPRVKGITFVAQCT